MLPWSARDHAALLHSQHDPHAVADPLVIVRAQGTRLFDAQGRSYFDGLSGLWNVNLGHGRADLIDAVTKQLSELDFAPSFGGWTHPVAIEAAEALQAVSGWSAGRVFWTNGGAEALEAAIKTARYLQLRRGHSTRNMLLCYDRAYHGTTIATSTATGFTAYQQPFGLTPVERLRLHTPGTVDWSVTRHLDELQQTIAQAGPQQIAALMAEPAWGAGGTYFAPPDYWPAVTEICQRHGILIIADEVITGCGRCGDWWYSSRVGLQPDLLCFAKGIANGLIPCGGMMVAAEHATVIQTAPVEARWWHSLTTSAHPAACAAALATIRALRDEQWLPRVEHLGAALEAALRTALLEHRAVRQIRRVGLLAGVELHAPAVDSSAGGVSPSRGEALLRAARRRGLLSRVRGETFQLAPPYCTTDAELSELVAILCAAIDEAAGK